MIETKFKFIENIKTKIRHLKRQRQKLNNYQMTSRRKDHKRYTHALKICH